MTWTAGFGLLLVFQRCAEDRASLPRLLNNRKRAALEQLRGPGKTDPSVPEQVEHIRHGARK